MTAEQNIEKLLGFINELQELGEFSPINTLKLKHINQRFLKHLFDYEESRGRDSIQTIIFSTEERTKDISIADSGSKTKKGLKINEGYYYRALGGLIRDIKSRTE